MGCLGRFAPTPSGRMHLGNVFSAMMAWLSARSQGGGMLLRIEDLDTLRCPAENAVILREDLRWLGMDWDFEQPCQSSRSGYYEEILERLARTGTVYPCWCTRGDLKNAPNAPHASHGHPIYPGTCRELSAEERQRRMALRPPLWRLRVPEETFTLIRSWAEREKKAEYLPIICQIALTKRLSEKRLLSAADTDLAEEMLNNLYNQGLLFAYMKKLGRFMPLPAELADKTLIEYRGDADISTEIGFRILPQEKDRPMVFTEMPHVFRGIYVNPVLLFSDEKLEYEIRTVDGKQTEVCDFRPPVTAWSAGGRGVCRRVRREVRKSNICSN